MTLKVGDKVRMRGDRRSYVYSDRHLWKDGDVGTVVGVSFTLCDVVFDTPRMQYSRWWIEAVYLELVK